MSCIRLGEVIRGTMGVFECASLKIPLLVLLVMAALLWEAEEVEAAPSTTEADDTSEAEGAPPHRTEHKRHHRGIRNRPRRGNRYHTGLERAMDRAACNYTFAWDVNELRIPQRIPRVNCKPSGTCQYNSSRQGCCTTLTVQLQVKYKGQEETQTFPIACACLKYPAKKMRKVTPPMIGPPSYKKKRRNFRRTRSYETLDLD